MSKFDNYYGYVEVEAVNFVDNYFEEVLDEIKDGDTDMQSFIDDSRLHEWCDNDFIYVDLLDSAHILDQSDSVETDSGLWEGQQPMDAIQTQAFFTYRNDMYHEIKRVFNEKLNEKVEELQNQWSELEEVQDFAYEPEDDEYQGDEEELQEKLDEIDEFIDNLKDAIDTL